MDHYLSEERIGLMSRMVVRVIFYVQESLVLLRLDFIVGRDLDALPVDNL